MTAILGLVLKYLPYLVQASTSIPEITGFLANLKAIFKREKTWTPEEEAEYRDFVEAVDIVSIIQAKARRFLDRHAAEHGTERS